jgi:MoxR-like ATPase
LNAVLSGKDLQGDPAENTGFRLLITQNPASTYEGRQDYSPALKRRFLTYELSNYNKTDLQLIAAKKGFKENEIDDIIEEFLDAQTIQKAQLSEDVITFNDFIDELDASKPREKAQFWKPRLPQGDTHNSTNSLPTPTGVDLCL